MKIRSLAAIAVLALSSYAATNVAPTKGELEAMYDKAFREFNANNYQEALRELDAIDARQPDLAESQNLRGVILMRQAQYDKAEIALQKALAADPKFWNARFNLAEIPFLRKDWPEARKRFDALLQGDASELQGEASQLIKYKILLTHLLQGNQNMVDSILAKLELSPETPAANYSHIAIAFQNKKEKEAKDLLATAEKNFSPQLNKLFAESLYEVGWLQKQAGQTRAALELTSAADRATKTKASAEEKYEQAEEAFQKLDLTAARALVDEADAANPNQAATINLRGEILLAQKDFDGAEASFKRALKLDPKLTEAHYNLAQIPFKKKDYARARERFETLFSSLPSGGDKNQTAQLVKFKMYLTLLLEGKDSRAQKIMEQFKFTGDTPALYYAQAAWEFKHDNNVKGNLWIVSARKIYSPALNLLFAESFYDLGWLQRQQAPAAAMTEVAKSDAPPIEPGPIPAIASTSQSADTAPKQPPDTTTASQASVATADTQVKDSAPSPADTGTLVAKNDQAQTVPAAPEAPTKSDASTAKTAPADAKATAPAPQQAVSSTTKSTDSLPQAQAQNPAQSAIRQASKPQAPVAVTKAATASTSTRQWTRPSFIEWLDQKTNSHTLGIVALLSAATVLLGWVVVAEVRRRVHGPAYGSPSPAPVPAMAPRFGPVDPGTAAAKLATPVRLIGGPPQMSLQLRASEPSVRRAAVPFGKVSRPFGMGGSVPPPGNGLGAERTGPRELDELPKTEPLPSPQSQLIDETAIIDESAMVDDSAVTKEPPAVLETRLPTQVSEAPSLASASEWEFTPAKTHAAPTIESTEQIHHFEPIVAKAADTFDFSQVVEPPISPVEAPDLGEPPASDRITVPADGVAEAEPVEPQSIETPMVEGPAIEPTSLSATVDEPIAVPSEQLPESEVAPVIRVPDLEPEPSLIEPIEQGQPIPYQIPAFLDDSVVTEATEVRFEPAESEPEPAEVEVEPVEATLESPEPGLEQEEIAQVEAKFEESQPEIETAEDKFELPEIEPEPAEAEHETAEPEPQLVDAKLEPAEADIEVSETELDVVPTDVEEVIDVSEPVPLMEEPPFAPQIISTEPLVQPTIPAIMPQTIQPTPVPIRTAPMTGATPQPAGGMQTAVQLTFSFEIASLQLTPSFKMGALQLKPTSKVVTMRLAPSQQPQPAMNLQVTFEVSSVQLAGNSIGIIRLTPSQQQRPGVINTPAFNIAGLQLLSGADSAVQLTPSQQGQASVHVTGRFQISTVEFSPSFEIASIVLNMTSKNVSVQLPGAGPSAVEGAPIFEIMNVQLAGNGDIGMVQLNSQGAGAAPKPA